MSLAASLLPCRVKSGCALVALAACAVATAAPLEPWFHVVVPGDTLIGIAAQLLQRPQDWRLLQRLNRVRDPRRLRPGTRLRIPVQWLRPQESTAELAEVVGNVSVGAADGATRAGQPGMVLHALDTLVTAPGASAVLRFVDGSRVLLAPGSRLTLQQLLVLQRNGAAATTLQLHEGGAEAQVRREPPRPRFEIKSPALNLGARGTDFRARFDPRSQQAHAEVVSGQVAASTGAGREVVLAAGFGIVAGPGAPGTPAPLLPAPDLGGVSPRVERLPVHLTWAAMPTARGWRAQVFEAQAAQRLLLEGVFDQPAALFADLPDGDYMLRVRAADNAGLEGGPAQTPFTLKARPEPPFLREPQPDAVLTGASVRFVWTLSSAAARYRLQLAPGPDFAAPLVDRSDFTGPRAEFPLSPGRWFWRLASVRADADQGPWSDTQSYELRSLPPPPAPPTTEEIKLDAGRILLRWATGQQGDRFEFQMARDAAFADVVTTLQVSEPHVALAAPPAGRYLIRARTIDAGGVAGPWGAPSEFEVGPSAWWWLVPALLLLLL